MTGRRRNSIIIGVTFVVIAALYGGLAPVLGYHIEWAGVTMLGALGVALGVLSYVLNSGSSD
jgi:type III secretory pathway component EscT